MEEKVCAYEFCQQPFIPRTHNQIYHSDVCCKLATNRRIMAKYYETKSRRNGDERVCVTHGCGTLLSRYNPDKVCAKCEAEQEASHNQRMLDILKDL